MKKNRSTLKDYFKKGAIPTEANFADLIDSMLNQEDDSISKLSSDPLKITAIGVDEALVNFYRIENSAEQLSWQVKQKPGGKAGLSIGDTTGSRLFIESATGKVGIGTTTPKHTLDVQGRINVENGVIQRGGDAITGTDLGLYSQNEGHWIRLVTKNAPINFLTDGGYGSIIELSVRKDFVNVTGKLGIGASATNVPNAKLDIQQEARSGTHPTAVKGLYVTGGFGADNDGVEFRHSNATQGLGFGYNTIYTAGTDANQNLGLKPRGTGKVIVTGSLQVTGQIQLDGAQKIVFSDADTTNNLKLQLYTGYGLGINNSTLFYAANGNHSWRDKDSNERMLLTTGADGGLTIKGTGNSSLAGSVGIGTTTPNYKLEVVGDISVGQKTTTPATGYGAKLYFNGASENSDAIWMARYNQSENASTLRLNLSDDGASDLLQVGYTNHSDSKWYTSFSVETNGNTAVAGSLLVGGNLNIAGSQNIVKVKTFTLAIKNKAKDTANTWSVDYTDQKFTEVYTVFVTLQGYSLWTNDTNFGNWGHVQNTDAIPQHTFVRVTSSDLKTASGTSYCSEAKADGESDNTVLFTVVVMGRI